MNHRLAYTVARQLAELSADAGGDTPDAELLGRFVADRDGAAFAALVRRHGPMVWAACRHLLPNPADAEDAFQATFLALTKSAHRVRSAAALGGWLHGVAVRTATTVRRTESGRRRRELAAAGPEAGRPVPDSAWDALLTAVHEEVERLPDALRTAFVLCDLEGVPQPAAAARLGWKPGTLTGRLARARQRLLDQLTKRGLAPAVAATGIGTATTGAAVPPGLNQTVLAWVTDPAGVPAAVSVLVAEVTAMTVSKMKLLAAGLMVAGGLGLGVGAGRVATVTAQVPADAPKPAAKAESPAAAPAANPEPPAKPSEPEPAKPANRWEFKYVVSPSGTLSSLGQIGNSAEQYASDGWEFVGVVQRTFVTVEDRKLLVASIPSRLPAILDRLDSRPNGGGRIDVMVFMRRKVAAPAAQSAGGSGGVGGIITIEGMAAIQFRQLAQWSGAADVIQFEKVPQEARDRWERSVKAGAYPPLPADGTMDETQFSKWFLNFTKTRAEERQRAKQANPPLPPADPSAGVPATSRPAGIEPADLPFSVNFSVVRLKHAKAQELAATLQGLFGTWMKFVPEAQTDSLYLSVINPDLNSKHLPKVEEFIRGRDVPPASNPFVPLGPAQLGADGSSPPLTAAEDLKLARVRQRVATVRLEEAKSQFDRTEAMVGQKVVSPTELAPARSAVRLAELQVEEAAIRVEAAERWAAEAAKLALVGGMATRTPEDQLKMAQARQAAALQALAKYKEAFTVTESLYKKGVASLTEFDAVGDAVLKLELEAAEANIRLEAAKRRAAGRPQLKPTEKSSGTPSAP